LYPVIARTDSRVTSVDVARRAGVSQSTVSLVLSGKSAGRISARTEAAVRPAASCAPARRGPWGSWSPT
jgi:transcriptional regulator with XRE-family HTH domain